ncbi:MAG TPA: F0F1 ATP synthase subunit A [Verrucomicrobiota bacterium]|nr:F0F1 ATP synthase subunit A [Verrucomicrobiota bacterium]
MRLLKTIFALAFLLVVPVALLQAADAAQGAVADAGHAATTAVHDAAHDASHGEHHGLPAAAPRIKVGAKENPWFEVTNSMILTWGIAIFIIIFAQIATRNIKSVPEGLQNFWEWLVEGLYNFLQDIIGPELIKKTFWFFATLFIFILFTNWFSLIPGVGTVGWGTPDESGSLHHISTPILRGVNADLNMTLAMAMIFFLFWTVWALQANGVKGFILHLFGPKGGTTGLLKLLMIFVFLLVGVLEVVSILFRPVSLSFRLYGNIFAGENMLESMAAMGGPLFGWLLALPFYAMELLVGVVQALVFMLLTAVFTLLICTHDDEGHGHEKAHH